MSEPSRARKIGTRVLIGVLSLSLVLGAVGVYFYKRFEGNITQLDITKDLGKDRPEAPRHRPEDRTQRAGHGLGHPQGQGQPRRR